VLQVGKLLIPTAEIISQGQAGPLRLGLRDGGAFDGHLGRDLLVDGLTDLRELGLCLPELCFAATEVGLLGRKLRLELLARGDNQGRRKGLRQLDLSSALRAGDLGVAHEIGPLMVEFECILVFCTTRCRGNGYPRQSRWPWKRRCSVGSGLLVGFSAHINSSWH
jgi:hypothetical protein